MHTKTFPIIIACLITLILGGLYIGGSGGILQVTENAFRDVLLLKSEEERLPDDRIKMIVIDDESLQTLGSFPWPRSLYADVADELMSAGAKAVAIDLLLLEPSADAQDDQRLSEVMKRWPSIYVPVQAVFPLLQKDKHSLEIERLDRPASTIGADKNQLGHVNVMQDQDGIIRRLTLGLPDEEGNMIPALSVRLANALLEKREQIIWDADKKVWIQGNRIIPTNDRYQVRIDYYSTAYDSIKGALRGYDRQSFSDVLLGHIDPNYYKDTIVLLGPYSQTLGDRHLTPVSRSIPLFGLEIHANMIQSLLEHDYYQEINPMVGLIMIFIITLLASISAAYFKGFKTYISFGLIILLYMSIGYMCFYLTDTYIPFLYGLLGILAGFVVVTAKKSSDERALRKHVTHLFGRYVSPDVVTALLASKDPIKPGGVRMDITVMFIDIRSFTPLAEQLSPEETLSILNRYLHMCTETVFRHQGTLDKFLGDGVMAIFGAPQRLESHVEFAADAALELTRLAEKWTADMEAEYGRGIQFGIGLECGEAVVGNIGSESLRMDYTAIGDTVNVAARLEGKALPGRIVIGPKAAARLESAYELHSIGRVELKGKSEPMELSELLGKR
ncbi:CHASE2 domain-containing protein [Paenibacillus aquistagni]|uniref:Adenylate cyclase n=1 Tax=Paenibacillus aquistagni TaxID=1852522 RepID=A0A1X7LII9_9BACL|nr:adenylate/guanylate cyclase domain-containing protein [Paenibacillus aquistagni]SMG53470.1 adenylate cyclase [Paenibacillus aquistagni]